MTSRRRHRTSSQLSREYRPAEGGEGDVSGRRRRRQRTALSHRLKRKVRALAMGFALFGVAGGLLALLVIELGDHPPGDAPDSVAASPGERAPTPRVSSIHGPVPVVTCPGTSKSGQHPAFAAACGDNRALKALLAHPGATEATDPRPEFAGRTPLHHAAQRGDTTMLGELLVAGANPNQADSAGLTPLHLVAVTPQLRNPEFVARRLLDGGARIDLRNGRGLTPIQELEADHKRLLEQPSLAQVLHQREREEQLAQWLTPSVPSDEHPLTLPSPEPPGESTVEVDTALGKVRIPVDPPAAGRGE